MAIIDVNKMFWEMDSLMKNNFSGTPAERYEKAKKLFLDSVAETIEENKEDLIKEAI